jgi:hypothetical protein
MSSSPSKPSAVNIGTDLKEVELKEQKAAMNDYLKDFDNPPKKANTSNYNHEYEQTGLAMNQVDPDREKVEQWTQDSLRKSTYFLFCFQIMMIILFAAAGTYVMPTAGTVTEGYTYFIGIEIMM